MPFIRVIDLETTGARPPAHDVCEIGWQDVALAPSGHWAVTEDRGSRLVNPGRPIPPVTQAVHHIIDEDVADAPFFRAVAPAILRPATRPLALAAHRASFEQRFCTPALSGGADWICTWKCALRLWPDSPSFSNQVLRYWRKPVGLDRERGLPVHRALPDAYVTAHHLRDMLAPPAWRADCLERGTRPVAARARRPGSWPRVAGDGRCHAGPLRRRPRRGHTLLGDARDYPAAWRG